MSTDTIRLKVTTLSNLFIGSAPTTYEIGGVDLYTVTDYEGRPYIPASSFKGALRNIVRDLIRHKADSIAVKIGERIGEAYKKYLNSLLQDNLQRAEMMGLDSEQVSKMKERYEKEQESATAECLFGMEGFNHTPKLIFSDLKLADTASDGNVDSWDDLFSIDSKNSLDYSEQSGHPQVSANPRTYKTVRPGVEFTGEILLYMMDRLTVSSDEIKTFIEHAAEQLNTGIYRLGNSGSRGYGRVRLEIIRERDAS
jgi:CRISPR-associated protein Csm3